jgi:hypothetical protein
MANFINEELFARQMTEALNAEMLRAAEPLLQTALQNIEVEMRKRLAAMVVGALDTSYRVERDGREIAIRVAMGKSESDTK